MKSLIALFILTCFNSFGQSYFSDHFGASIGIVAKVGTHQNGIGVTLKAFYTDYFFQINAGNTLNLYHKSIGGRKRFVENRSSIGTVLLGGKKQTTRNQLLDGLNHQTEYNLGIGFNYLFYFDNRGTSQTSGGFGLHIHEFSLYHENDLFGGNGRDRFRTGHIYTNYRYYDFQFGLGVNIWTGESSGAPINKTPAGKSVHGFKLLENLPYGKTSHGIAYGSISYHLPYQQTIQVRLGVDSEHVRHAVQNRLIHDVIFLPSGWIQKQTPHYPRLDEYGCPVFSKEDVRENRFYLQYGSNENWAN
ncbi:MAG: polymorphic toxin type 23 domain-containing protein [Crocinitomicaceae bacterium]|nr:polymorphic toxin type 23 domain-containing protein [Crocinitomicaceae bacterium]